MQDFLYFETERLYMRPLALDDAPFILALNLDPAWQRYIGDRGVYDLASAETYIVNGPQRMYRDTSLGVLAVCRHDSHRFLGTCGLLMREALSCPDIGFAFLASVRGQGYAHEAAQAICQRVVNTQQWPELNALVSPDNQASINLLQKLGFVYQSPLPDFDASRQTHLYQLSTYPAQENI